MLTLNLLSRESPLEAMNIYPHALDCSVHHSTTLPQHVRIMSWVIPSLSTSLHAHSLGFRRLHWQGYSFPRQDLYRFVPFLNCKCLKTSTSVCSTSSACTCSLFSLPARLHFTHTSCPFIAQLLIFSTSSYSHISIEISKRTRSINNQYN